MGDVIHYREAKPRSTPPSKADAYAVFLKLFVEQMPKSPSHKKLLDELREVLVVRTNLGTVCGLHYIVIDYAVLVLERWSSAQKFVIVSFF